ncbi:hypothetical protein GS944_15560 [Rhodococcus hoagii]|nr:hypothetical protein [Prescottella equi]
MTMVQGGGGAGGPSSQSLADVVDTILDKGLVIDAYVRVSLVGIELVTIDARVVVASVDTYLRFAEAVNRLEISETQPKGLPDMVQDMTTGVAEGKTKGAIEAAARRCSTFSVARRTSVSRSDAGTPAEARTDERTGIRTGRWWPGGVRVRTGSRGRGSEGGRHRYRLATPAAEDRPPRGRGRSGQRDRPGHPAGQFRRPAGPCGRPRLHRDGGTGSAAALRRRTHRYRCRGAELLEPYRDEFHEALEQLEGKVEFVVKGKYVEDAILREILADDRRRHDCATSSANNPRTRPATSGWR